MREGFAMQKLLINILNFNEMLTKDVVSFEQSGPGERPFPIQVVTYIF